MYNNKNKFLVFLDFDGVTHPITGTPMFIPQCMSALSTALKSIDLELVVSSSWRETKSFDELKEILSPLGKKVQGITPVIDDPFLKNVRYYEVLDYLKESKQENLGWIAIDDCRGFYPDEAPVYWTDIKTGFTEKDIAPLVEMIVRQQAQWALQINEYSDYNLD